MKITSPKTEIPTTNQIEKKSLSLEGMIKLPVTRAEKTAWEMNKVLYPENLVTLVAEVDATEIQKLRLKARANGEISPSFTSLVLKAAALTLKKYPEANRAILGFPFFKHLYEFKNIDIGIAVEKSLPYQPGSPFATPIRNSVEKSLAEITNELHELAICTEDTNENLRDFMRILKYVPRPLSLWLLNAPYRIASLWVRYRGCAAWVNAPSKSGSDLVMTAWPWPITFSFGLVKERPVVVSGKLEVRLTMPIVMVFDRRIMGGGPAGRIFAHFKEILDTANFQEKSSNVGH